MARAAQVGFARCARSVAVGHRRRAIGRAAPDLVDAHLAGIAIVQPDDRQAEVQQVGQDIEQRRFLSAMLRRRRRKGGADLAGQQALRPDTPGGVRSEEPTSELQSLMRTSYAVYCL